MNIDPRMKTGGFPTKTVRQSSEEINKLSKIENRIKKISTTLRSRK